MEVMVKMSLWIIWRKGKHRGEDTVYFQCGNGREGDSNPHMYPTAISVLREMDWLIKNQPELGWQVKEIKFE